ncbi:MAG TPA: MFS transporter [Methylomusa anaerophila]|uniref:Bacillibactin exporter n=1 Tax=Methylomusa anaerophila TaxID=1930071 RepID=A0A348AQJ6_9FIRM|nr:MFS transporter [Methylomusa anaerophila]BBB93344.1 bacillibactin exporter [Methylomusa anaerophila]HML86826.1 MFS transporter [Methylomusa anaerophila]
MHDTNNAVRQSLWNKDFIILALSNLLLFMVFDMLMPTLPVFIAKNGGISSQVGLIMGSFTFSAIFIRVITGNLGPAINKKNLLVLGVTGCMLATACYYWSTSSLGTFAIRLLHGLGFGVATTLYATFAAAFIPSRRRGEGLGYFGVGETIGISVGPFLGIWLMDQHGFGSVFGVGTLILLFAVFITLAVASPLITEEETKPFQQEIQKKNSLLELFIEKRVFLQSGLALLFGMPFGGILSFIALHAREAGIPNVAYFFFVNAIAVLLVRIAAGQIFDRKGPGILIGASAILCSIGTFLLAMASTTTALIITAAFYGTGMGAAFPALQAWCINVVPVDRREHAMGTFLNSFDLGIGLGTILLGAIAAMSGYSLMYISSILFLILYWLLYQIFGKRQDFCRKGKQ